MTDDTIKITREMPRAAWDDVSRGFASVKLRTLEEQLFGPKKPRELTLYRANDSELWREITGSVWEDWQTMRVREVLGE